jgi:hypothetical protein
MHESIGTFWSLLRQDFHIFTATGILSSAKLFLTISGRSVVNLSSLLKQKPST